PSVTLSEPFAAKTAAPLSASWLHHASAYRFANAFKSARSFMRVSGIALVNLDEAFAYHDARSADPRCLNASVRILGASQESARTPHLDSLGDAPAKIPVRLFAVVGQQSGQCAIGASSSRVFRNAAQWCEHAST